MVTVKIGDGMGNQMYNYACGYAAARRANEGLRLDISECDNSTLRDFELDKFHIVYDEKESFPNDSVWKKIYKRLRRNLKYHVIFEKDMYHVDERVFGKFLRGKYLHGYWQCLGYFEEYFDEIREMFTPNYEQSPEVKRLTEQFRNTPTCALHVRGGDLGGPNREYFEKAAERMQKEKPGVSFIVFTNDVPKARECLENGSHASEMKYVTELGQFSDMDEFFLMSACQNQIISNSTYSTWAAYLNTHPGRCVIVPDFHGVGVMALPDWIVLS